MTDPEYTIYTSVKEIYKVDVEPIRLAAWCALDVAGAQPPLALTVILASEAEVRQLNRDYAGEDAVTDVLSFPAEDEPYATDPGDPPYLGDVVIAYPVAARQAHAANHSLMAELQLLAIHGTLHLLGYDHDTPDHQAEMWALQSAAMDALRAGGA